RYPMNRFTLITVLTFLFSTAMGQVGSLDNWTSTWPTNSQVSFGVKAVTYDNSQFVAVGGIIETSSDGVSWAVAQSGVTNSLGSVTFGNGRFVAVATWDYKLIAYESTTLISSNGWIG